MADEVQFDAREFQRFYRALGQMDPAIKKALRKRIRDLAKPITADVKAAALEIPVKKSSNRSGSMGLRKSLSMAAKYEIRATKKGAVVHFRIGTKTFMSAANMPRTIPYYVEGRRKRPWRHPVFGNPDVWVEQDPHPFLGATVMSHKNKFMEGMQKAVDDALDELQREIKAAGNN